MRLETFETLLVIAGIIVGSSLVVAIGLSRLRSGLQDDTIASYKNALDAAKEETSAAKHEAAETRKELAAAQAKWETQNESNLREIAQLREQIKVLSNIVTARDEIGAVRELLESHHREDMAAHEKMQQSIRDLIALRGGTRASETFDTRSDDGETE